MTPIVLPPPTHPAWIKAKAIAAAFRARGHDNPIIVAAVANAYAESSWTAVIAGDHGESFGPWQCKWSYYGEPILAALKIDIRTETDFAKHVDAVLFALKQAGVLDDLLSCETGEDVTRIWAAKFERASAGGAVDRRTAIAGKIEVWLAKAA